MKKLLMVISMLLLVAMMPFALFGCDSEGEETEGPTENVEGTENGGDSSESGKSTNKTTQKKETQGKTDNPTEPVVEARTVKLLKNESLFKRLGRTHLTQTGIACDHIASGIEFTAVMKGDVKLKITSKIIKTNSPKSYFTVYIDGERQDKRYEVGGTQNLLIASFETQGEHTIKIVRQTENNYTVSEFKELSFTGYMLDRPEDKELYIEVIGDSITCGMGNIGVNGCSEPQSSLWEDGSQSYGYMLAEDLDADYSIISQSGIGLSASWDDPMVPFYTCASYNRDTTTQHDFKRVPDLVIINLGTNDYFIGGTNSGHANKAQATPEALKTKAKEFIELVRTKYGEDVPIIWTIGLIGVGQNYVDATKAAVTELGGEAVGLYFLKTAAGELGAGQNHPSINDNVSLKNQLIDLINDKEILG